MANIDLLGPASAPGAVTARPAESRVFGQNETWFAPCTSQSSRDGTQLQAVFQNGLLAQIRYALKASGITLDNTDDAMLWKAILAAVAAGAPPGTSLWHTADDTSNAAGTIVASVIPTITAYGRFWYGIRVAQTCAGATQAVINGLPPRSVVRSDGAPLKAGDYVAGQEVILADDGTKLQVAGLVPSQITNVAAQTPVGKGLFTDITPGSRSWTVPDGVYWVYATCVGAGAGGTGVQNGDTRNGAGGGAGGTAARWIAVTPGQSIPYVVGAGSAGVAFRTMSANGGTSSISTALQGGGGLGTNNSGLAGGAGGIGTGGQVNLVGGAGTDGNAVDARNPAGNGGASSLGGGGRAATVYEAAVSDGRAPGSGGGGVYQGVTSQGGNGAAGYVSFQY